MEKHPEKQEEVRHAVELILHLPLRRFEVREREVMEIAGKLERAVAARENHKKPLSPDTIPLNARVVSQKRQKPSFFLNRLKRMAVVASVILTLFVALSFLMF